MRHQDQQRPPRCSWPRREVAEEHRGRCFWASSSPGPACDINPLGAIASRGGGCWFPPRFICRAHPFSVPVNRVRETESQGGAGRRIATRLFTTMTRIRGAARGAATRVERRVDFESDMRKRYSISHPLARDAIQRFRGSVEPFRAMFVNPRPIWSIMSLPADSTGTRAWVLGEQYTLVGGMLTVLTTPCPIPCPLAANDERRASAVRPHGGRTSSLSGRWCMGALHQRPDLYRHA